VVEANHTQKGLPQNPRLIRLLHLQTPAHTHVGVGSNWLSDGPYAQQDNVYDVWGNTLGRTGWGGTNPQYGAGYTNNRMIGMVYDATGNLTDAGGGWTFTYDATGQQATSAVGNCKCFTMVTAYVERRVRME